MSQDLRADTREHDFRQLIDNNPEAILVTADGRLAFANPAALRLLGALEPGEVVGRRSLDFVDPELHDLVGTRIRRILNREEVVPVVEERWRRVDGTLVELEVTAGPVTWQGQPGVQVMARDITQRKRAEEEVRRVYERLDLLLRAASGLLVSERPREYVRSLFDVIAHRIGVDVYFNFLAEEQDGVERLHLDSSAGVEEEVVRTFEWLDYGDAVCGTVAERRERMVLAHVDSRTDAMTDLLRRLGVTSYVCHPLIADGSLVGTLSYGRRDGRSFSPTEVDLLHAISEQVAVAIDRSRSREAERLSREAAERASAVKSQFLSTMSHELRTPLTAVIGLSDLLETEVLGPLNARQKDSLARVQASAWHLVSMIDEILSFSRSEAGKEQARLAKVDVAEIARGVVSMLSTEAGFRGLELRVRGTDQRLVVLTDGGKVRQILTNLLGNALKYTDAGVVELEVDPADDGPFRISVRDTGVGIHPERLEEIFEPFVQLDGSMTRNRGGAGLGLAVSRRLARLLGGDVEVRSEPGRGSTFTLHLPRNGRPALHGERPSREDRPAGEGGVATSGGNTTVTEE